MEGEGASQAMRNANVGKEPISGCKAKEGVAERSRGGPSTEKDVGRDDKGAQRRGVRKYKGKFQLSKLLKMLNKLLSSGRCYLSNEG